jgi:filamentous hemagglutinin family protein
MHKALKSLFLTTLPLATLSCLLPLNAKAQITTDNTLGNENSRVTRENIRGIPSDRIDGGATRGNNLFHSFREFNINAGRGAYFANPAGIENIFSRVTGNNISNILGRLGVLGNANLFFINPNGIFLGENASLDLRGSFFASTADSLIFDNGFEFSASDPTEPPLLTINIPIGANFRDNPGDITNRSVAPNFNGIPTGLQVQQGKNISLIGGDVSLESGGIYAPGGRVELGGLNSAGTIGISNNGSLNFPENVERGNVFLSNASNVNVLSGGGGSIAINSKNLELTEGSFLQTGIGVGLGSPEAQGGDIIINATDKVSFDGVGASSGIFSGIYSSVFNQGLGNTGKIQVTTSDLSLTNGGTINSTLLGTGNTGNIDINASNNIFFDGVNILKQSNITNQIAPTGSGSTGNINISARNFSLTNGASINSFNSGKGTLGNININASDTISVDGSIEPFVSGIFSSIDQTGRGNAGEINLDSNALILTNGGSITSFTLGEGNSGNITINARDNISLDGEAEIDNPLVSTITTSSIGVGNSGNIDIDTQNLSLTNGASIGSAATGNGNAGDINITATDSISIDGQGSREGLFSSINSGLTQSAIGNGGNLKIATGNLRISNNGKILGSSTGKGNGAGITIEATEKILLDRGAIDSSIFTLPQSFEEQEFAEGNGGDINITAKNVSLVNNSSLTSFSTGKGNGGMININATEKVFLERSSIITSVFGGNFPVSNTGINFNFVGEGNSGNIDIKSDQILLNNNAQIITVNGGIGNAGNISLAASNLFSAVNSSTITSNIGQGNGTPAEGKVGNIRITAQNVFLMGNATIQAGFFSNSQGESGIVSIKAIDSISFDDRSAIFTSVNLGAIANGGDIQLEANSISFTNGSGLTASIEGIGNAGNITVNADSLTLDQFSGILAFNTPSESLTTDLFGGNITLNIADNLILRNNSPITALASENANGGNVNIDTQFIIAFPNQNNDITANAFQGKGGNINLTAESIFGIEERPLNLFTNDINASSQFGLQGGVEINTPDIDPTRGLIDLTQTVTDPEEQISQNPCEQTVGSEFIITGKGGIPPNPHDRLTSDVIRVDLVEPVSLGRRGDVGAHGVRPMDKVRSEEEKEEEDNDSSVPEEIVPAQGWIFNDKGQVMLTSYDPTKTGVQRSWQTPNSCPAP